ncbi:preprotein translocase subunit SecG [Paratissierella segnis]|jgi:preprotein translocase subunit SecG|uniref:Protein-export membrane protein SecG n=1 Tax=Paratissierella segnis TaxID=2763679 RepID=A0A926EZY6_9FIRM|nr:preprotein translocase subunit SecG [Paratissierella segnis]MBC8589492.1 preprotein translocase subunit SecG [Paratissierella segnis]
MTMFFSVLILISSISLIISVLLQEGSEEGLGTIGGNAPESLWGKNRGTSKQAMLQRVTIIAAIIFLISALGLAA